MPTINVNACNINFVRAGARGKPPLVFLHGVGLDLTWWNDQFAEFGGDQDVVAIDMPGHGLSGKPASPPSFKLLLEATCGVIGQLGGPAHVIGVSAGGMIAQTLALHRPELVCSLSLVATLCTFPDPVRDALRERARVARTQGMARIAQLSTERWFTEAFRRARPDIVDRATRSLLLQDAELHASMWDMIAGLDLTARIPAIECPTLVIAGTEDVNAPVAAGRQIADLIPGASLMQMPGIAHFPPFEAPAQFNAILRRFIGQVNGGTDNA